MLRKKKINGSVSKHTLTLGLFPLYVMKKKKKEKKKEKKIEDRTGPVL